MGPFRVEGWPSWPRTATGGTVPCMRERSRRTPSARRRFARVSSRSVTPSGAGSPGALVLTAALVALVLAVALAVLAGGAGGRPQPTPVAVPALRELVGQRLIVALEGTAASPALLRRVRRGEVGGVILFGANVTGATQLRMLTTSLQRAARAAGRPPLLVMVDQEGGLIRRLPWAGPRLSAAELGRATPSSVRRAGLETGRALRAVGVNVDLAPVADVSVAGSFMAAEERTFSGRPAHVAVMATAFATGLADARVAAVAKHFPGIGRAVRSTDRTAVTLAATRAELERDLMPFRRAVAAGVPVVMLSNAAYTAFGPAPGAWSTSIQGLLRRELGFRGVTITDALEAAAATRGKAVPSAAALAASAGVDLVLLTGGEADSAAVYRWLLDRATAGAVPLASLRRSYDRVLLLKQRLR